MFVVIYQTQETVFHWDIQTPRRELKIQLGAEYFDEIRGLWIADEALSRVFDITSQSKQKLRSKQRSKIVKTCAKTRYPDVLHGCDFLSFNLMKY